MWNADTTCGIPTLLELIVVFDVGTVWDEQVVEEVLWEAEEDDDNDDDDDDKRDEEELLVPILEVPEAEIAGHLSTIEPSWFKGMIEPTSD